jgi:hypothetical protein
MGFPLPIICDTALAERERAGVVEMATLFRISVDVEGTIVVSCWSHFRESRRAV